METLIGTDPQAPHTFRFEPEQHFKNEFTNQNWSILDERNYFIQLTKSEKNDYPRLNFSFIDTTISLRPITPASVNDSVESNSLKYRFEVRHSADSSNVYEGISHFKLYKSVTPPETWHIYYWQDNAIDNKVNISWTFLKLLIRKQTSS